MEDDYYYYINVLIILLLLLRWIVVWLFRNGWAECDCKFELLQTSLRVPENTSSDYEASASELTESFVSS